MAEGQECSCQVAMAQASSPAQEWWALLPCACVPIRSTPTRQHLGALQDSAP